MYSLYVQCCSCKDGTICARFFQFPTQTSPIIARLVCVPEKASSYYLLNAKTLCYNCSLATSHSNRTNIEIFHTKGGLKASICAVLHNW